MNMSFVPHQIEGNVNVGPSFNDFKLRRRDCTYFPAKEKLTVMKRNLLKKRVMGVVLGLSLLVGIGIASSHSVAQAQWRDRDYQREQLRRQREWEREQRRRQRQADRWDDRYDRGGSFDMRQTALNAGYNEGIKEGRKDRNNRERYEYREEEASAIRILTTIRGSVIVSCMRSTSDRALLTATRTGIEVTNSTLCS